MRERMHPREAETARRILAPFTLAFYTHQSFVEEIFCHFTWGIPTPPTFIINNRMSLAWYMRQIWYQYFQDHILDPIGE